MLYEHMMLLTASAEAQLSMVWPLRVQGLHVCIRTSCRNSNILWPYKGDDWDRVHCCNPERVNYSGPFFINEKIHLYCGRKHQVKGLFHTSLKCILSPSLSSLIFFRKGTEAELPLFQLITRVQRNSLPQFCAQKDSGAVKKLNTAKGRKTFHNLKSHGYS